MAVRKINGRWYVDVRLEGTRYRKVSPHNTKKGAEDYEVVLRQRVARGEPIEGIQEPQEELKRTYKDYVAEWMKTYVEANNKASEATKKEGILRVHLIPFFNKTPINKIDTLSIERYKSKKMAAGLSPKTINNHLTTLRKSLSCAKDWGYIDRLPKVTWLKAPTSKVDTLSKKEQERLLSDEEDPLWNLVILTGLRTGMRVGEMLALHWSDVNFQRSEICVRFSLSDKQQITSTKNNRIRYVPMGVELHQRLHAWKRQRKGKKIELVFGVTPNTPYLRQSSYDAIRRICKRVNVRRIGWHILRHTFATELCARAVPLRAVQELLGHSTIIMTERYAHVGKQTLRHAVALLEGEFITFGQYMGNEQKRSVVSETLWPTD